MDNTVEEGSGRTFLALWSVALVALFLVAGWFMISTISDYRDKAAARHQARVDPTAVEPGRTASEDKLPAGAKPRRVTVGMYVDGIASISIMESGWSPTFYIWFRWKDDGINPGETFRIVDGEILSRQKVKEEVVNGEHYAVYLVRAQMTKFFSADRFPVDDHLLTIAIEDEKMRWTELEWVPDAADSGVSSRVKMPGYGLFKSGLVVKPHTYKTNFGDPRVQSGNRDTYSQLICGIWNVRTGYGPYCKVFLGLFAAVLIAMLAFFIKPTDVDPRFGLGVGGFFGAVANTFIAAGLVPDSGALTLMDMVNGLGMLTIFLCITQSTISLYLYDIKGREALSKTFDRVSFVIIATGYAAINVLVPFMGMMH